MDDFESMTVKWTHAVKCAGGKDAFISVEITARPQEGETSTNFKQRINDEVEDALVESTWAFNDAQILRTAANGAVGPEKGK